MNVSAGNQHVHILRETEVSRSLCPDWQGIKNNKTKKNLKNNELFVYIFGLRPAIAGPVMWPGDAVAMWPDEKEVELRPVIMSN